MVIIKHILIRPATHEFRTNYLTRYTNHIGEAKINDNSDVQSIHIRVCEKSTSVFRCSRKITCKLFVASIENLFSYKVKGAWV